MSGWSLFGLLIGLELTGLDWQTAETVRSRFYRAVADFVYHGSLAGGQEKLGTESCYP
jgi:hypothetical protein